MTAVIDAPFENMQDTAAKMLDTKVPAEHQRLGRQVNNYDGKKWDASTSLTMPTTSLENARLSEALIGSQTRAASWRKAIGSSLQAARRVCR